MNADVAQKVIELSAEQAGVDAAQVSAATHYVNDLNFDSLDVVELVMSLEDEFEISIGDEEAEKLPTVGSVIDYVEKRKAAE